ncbi:hypothetical protein EYF80_039705 [Liparis tanakae]|uniref:Uncharacterized protein n=1 Tax=Liparis tanakae TaxID=230148 RepID=A0A4Z2G9A5_9TELE|nr:hypothetical protein EYF80_039705 [Liparis tanakae]
MNQTQQSGVVVNACAAVRFIILGERRRRRAYLLVMRRELTKRYSPSYRCSMTVILPMGLLSRVRMSPETTRFLVSRSRNRSFSSKRPNFRKLFTKAICEDE